MWLELGNGGQGKRDQHLETHFVEIVLNLKTDHFQRLPKSGWLRFPYNTEHQDAVAQHQQSFVFVFCLVFVVVQGRELFPHIFLNLANI